MNMRESLRMIRRMVEVLMFSKGIGELKCPNGEVYKGEWRDDEKDGEGDLHLKWRIGIWIYPNGDKYEGDIVNNERSGKGKFKSKDVGTMNYNNGDCYVGDWKNDKRDGEGILL